MALKLPFRTRHESVEVDEDTARELEDCLGPIHFAPLGKMLCSVIEGATRVTMTGPVAPEREMFCELRGRAALAREIVDEWLPETRKLLKQFEEKKSATPLDKP